MTAALALASIQEAFRQGRYFIGDHARQRMHQRKVTILDIIRAVAKATKISGYVDPKRPLPASTSCWRLTSEDLRGATLMLGVDLAYDHLGPHAEVITVI